MWISHDFMLPSRIRFRRNTPDREPQHWYTWTPDWYTLGEVVELLDLLSIFGVAELEDLADEAVLGRPGVCALAANLFS